MKFFCFNLLGMALSALDATPAIAQASAPSPLVPQYAAAPQGEDWNPQAAPEAIVTSGRARFTVLTPRLIRIQYSQSSTFEDRATFAVVNRRLPVPAFTTREEDGYLYIQTEALTLRYKTGSSFRTAQRNGNNLRVTFTLNGKEKLWYPGKDDALNLLGTNRTLDGNIGDTHRVDLENGVLSRDGWALLDESYGTLRGDGSRSLVFDGQADGIAWVAEPADKAAADWYLFCHGHDYKAALADYVSIAGRQPLPPRYMFGYWYSKYQAYTQSEIQQLAREMEQNRLPHDVLMIDTDWHQYGWTGWTWNTQLIPNPTGLLAYLHNRNLKTSLNLHPADGIGTADQGYAEMCAELGTPSGETIPWQLESKDFYRSFFAHIMRPKEEQGVDFWWIDWQQALTSSEVPGLSHTFWLNHVFYNDMRLNRTDRRPVIFHRWGGMGSHRYPLGFSGDTFATWGTLQYEAYFTATAANAAFSYWGHDGGGYLQPAERPTDPELMLRWMQFAVFQPLFRTHGSSQAACERRVWKFDNLDLQRQTFRLRYSLTPYIYTCAREAYDTGLSICRPLYYEWPEANRAYSTQDEYLFGPDILVAPIAAPAGADNATERNVWLPEGRWFDVSRSELKEGPTDFTDRYSLGEIPYFIRQGVIIPCNPDDVSSLQQPVGKIVLWVIPGADGEGQLYEDHGDTDDYRTGAFATTRFAQERHGDDVTLTISPRLGHYDGMPETRAYEARFLLQARPAAVLVDDVPTAFAYDEQQRQLSVEIASRPCSDQAVVRVVCDPSSISASPASAALAYDSATETVTLSAARQASAISITVVDSTGRKWQHATFSATAHAVLSLQTQPPGEYIVHALVDGFPITRKIIKP